MSGSTDVRQPRPPRPTALPSRTPSITATRPPPSIFSPKRPTSTVARNASSAARIVVQNSPEQSGNVASSINNRTSQSAGSSPVKRPPVPVPYHLRNSPNKIGSSQIAPLAPVQSNLAPRNIRATASVRSRPPPRPSAPPLARRSISQGSIHASEPLHSTSAEEAAREEARSILTSSPLKDLGTEILDETVAPSRVAPKAQKETLRTPGAPVYVAAYEYNGESDAELTFRKGEGIMLLEDEANEDGWVRGMNESGEEGFLPITYLED